MAKHVLFFGITLKDVQEWFWALQFRVHALFFSSFKHGLIYRSFYSSSVVLLSFILCQNNSVIFVFHLLLFLCGCCVFIYVAVSKMCLVPPTCKMLMEYQMRTREKKRKKAPCERVEEKGFTIRFRVQHELTFVSNWIFVWFATVFDGNILYNSLSIFQCWFMHNIDSICSRLIVACPITLSKNFHRYVLCPLTATQQSQLSLSLSQSFRILKCSSVAKTHHFISRRLQINCVLRSIQLR